MKTKKTLQHIAAVAVVLLALCLVFAAPVGATNVAFINDVGYETLNDAFDNVSSDQTIVLAAGTISDSLTVFSNEYKKDNITIRGNESGTILTTRLNIGNNTPQDMSITVEGITFRGEEGGLWIHGYKNVTIKDNTFTGITDTEGVGFMAGSGKRGVITLHNLYDSGTVTVDNNTIQDSYMGIHVGGFYNLVINENEIANVEYNSITVHSDKTDEAGSLSITGNTMNIWGTANHDDKVGNDGRALRASSLSDIVVVFKDNFMIHDNAPEEFVKMTDLSAEPTTSGNKVNDKGANGVYSSSTYLIDPVATTNAGAYNTLAAAVGAVGTGETITLLNDAEVSSVIEILKTGITLVGNGHTITPSSPFNSDEPLLRAAGANFKMIGVTIDDSSRVTSSAISAVILKGANSNLTDNVIKAGKSNYHRSTGILVYATADDTILMDNEIYLGTSDSSRTDAQRNESIGIRVYPTDSENDAMNGLRIVGNTIVENESTNPQVGILIDGAQIGDQISVTGNIFELGTDNGAIIEVMAEKSAPTLALTFKDNNVKSAKTFLSLVEDTWGENEFTLTLSGEISNDLIGVSSFSSIVKNETLSVPTGIITGGTFSFNPSAYIASGYEVVQPGDKYLVQLYVDRSSSSSSSSTPVEPEEPEQPEEPVVEPETPAAPGEVASSTEVTDGGEVAFETTVVDEETGEQSAPAAADSEIKGVVLPTGTEGTVEFVPVSEQAAPAGQEENTKRVFEINVPNYEKGKAAVIKFQMTIEELAADGKTAEQVALWHFDEETGEWTKLVTSYTIVNGIVYFEAITNDFSPFAIIYDEAPVDEPEQPTEEPETPASPAPVLGLLAALGAAVVLRRK